MKLKNCVNAATIMNAGEDWKGRALPKRRLTLISLSGAGRTQSALADGKARRHHRKIWIALIIVFMILALTFETKVL